MSDEIVSIDLSRWSEPQRRAITTRGSNILVSAGAGSGKTSVLVERVIRCITGPGAVDIHRLLIATFTEAAAAEMRHRIALRLRGLYDDAVLAEDRRAMRHLSRQLGLIEQAHISTLHSFCMDVVRRNFLTLGLEPSFRILSEDDALVTRIRIFENVFDQLLLEQENARRARSILRRFGDGQPQRLMQLVFRIDVFSRSQADPDAWLDSVTSHYTLAGAVPFAELPWVPAFRRSIQARLGDCQTWLEQAWHLSLGDAVLAAYEENTKLALEHMIAAKASFEQNGHMEDALPFLQAVESTLGQRVTAKDHPAKADIQALRKDVKANLQIVMEFMERGEAGLTQDLTLLCDDVHMLALVVKRFQSSYAEWKRTQGTLDFSDLEHFALRALCDERSGEALRLQDEFAEIFVDEYQDTSPIQDAIIAAIERQQGNVFVVGDVKQSIYRFRMAEPKLFLGKYRGEHPQGKPIEVIDLLDNYRSRRGVVDAVNFLFSQLFSESFGGISYDDRAAMRVGADYREPDTSGSDENSSRSVEYSSRSDEGLSRTDAYSAEGTGTVDAAMDGLSLSGPVEVHLIERSGSLDGNPHAADDSTGAIGRNAIGRDAVGPENTEGRGTDAGPSTAGGSEEDGPAADGFAFGSEAAQSAEPQDSVNAEELSAIEKEALVVGGRILELLGRVPGHKPSCVWNAKEKQHRPLQFRDIVILMRSVRGRMNTVLEILGRMGIPSYGVTSTGFYGTMEVKWLLAALGTVDNPRREIELATLMRSPMFGFRDDELALIRTAHPGNFYEAIVAAVKDDTSLPEALISKVTAFLKRLRSWRSLARRSTAETVVKEVLHDTDFVHYVSGMQGGAVRKANVEMFIERVRAFDETSIDGVFGFFSQARQSLDNQVDTGEARTLGESEDVVRVMTIHQSKGLEFPVVFVIDLGKQFFKDAKEQAFALHRELGFGPEFSDYENHRRWRTMPSIALSHVEREETLAEEARVLYVAMTRAKERLILVGSARRMLETTLRAVERASHDELTLPANTLLGARTYLDWLLPAMVRHRDFHPFVEAAQDTGGQPGEVRPLSSLWDAPVRFRPILWNEMGGNPLPRLVESSTGSSHPESRLLDEVGRFLDAIMNGDYKDGPVMSKDARDDAAGTVYGVPVEECPREVVELDESDEINVANEADVVRVQAQPDLMLHWQNPTASGAGIPGKISATDLRRLWAAKQGHGHGAATFRNAESAERLLAEPSFVNANQATSMFGGTAFHTVMQHIDFRMSPTNEDVNQFVSELVHRGMLTADQAAEVAVDSIVGLLTSYVGKRLAAAKRVLREQPFFNRIALPGDRFVIAQGVIDCLAEEDGGWLLVDYKTDRVDASGAHLHAREYAAQIATYLQVARSVCGGKPVEAMLYFVRPQVVVPMEDMDLAKVFV